MKITLNFHSIADCSIRGALASFSAEAVTISEMNTLAAFAQQTLGVDISPLATGGTVVPAAPVAAAPTVEEVVASAPPSAPAAPAILPGAVQHDMSDLDANGHPWDGRIHQKTKGKTAKSIWKKLKNIAKTSPGLVEQVETEFANLIPLDAGDIPPHMDRRSATPPPPPGAVPPAPPSAPGALAPAHQAVVNSIQDVITTQPAPVAGGYVNYGIDENADHPTAALAFLKLFGADDVNAIADVPENWEGMQAGIDWLWPVR